LVLPFNFYLNNIDLNVRTMFHLLTTAVRKILFI
jgi:hypothetical protein